MADKIKILEFIDNIDKAYSSADILICRAGITSIMEIAFMKSVSILIPLPTQRESSGTKCKKYRKRGGAVVVLQNEAKDKLLLNIIKILNDDDLADSIKENAGKCIDPEVAFKIAGEVIINWKRKLK
ncbi:MAG: glycosyltransferase [Ignavibacteria bacterium]